MVIGDAVVGAAQVDAQRFDILVVINHDRVLRDSVVGGKHGDAAVVGIGDDVVGDGRVRRVDEFDGGEGVSDEGVGDGGVIDFVEFDAGAAPSAEAGVDGQVADHGVVGEDLDCGAAIDEDGEAAEVDATGVDGHHGLVVITGGVDDGRGLVLPNEGEGSVDGECFEVGGGVVVDVDGIAGGGVVDGVLDTGVVPGSAAADVEDAAPVERHRI